MLRPRERKVVNRYHQLIQQTLTVCLLCVWPGLGLGDLLTRQPWSLSSWSLQFSGKTETLDCGNHVTDNLQLFLKLVSVMVLLGCELQRLKDSGLKETEVHFPSHRVSEATVQGLCDSHSAPSAQDPSLRLSGGIAACDLCSWSKMAALSLPPLLKE